MTLALPAVNRRRRRPFGVLEKWAVSELVYFADMALLFVIALRWAPLMVISPISCGAVVWKVPPLKPPHAIRFLQAWWHGEDVDVTDRDRIHAFYGTRANLFGVAGITVINIVADFGISAVRQIAA